MPAALPVLPDPGQKGLPCPVGRFLAWEGLEGEPLVCLGLLVRVEQSPAVVGRLVAVAQIGLQPPIQTSSQIMSST